MAGIADILKLLAVGGASGAAGAAIGAGGAGRGVPPPGQQGADPRLQSLQQMMQAARTAPPGDYVPGGQIPVAQGDPRGQMQQPPAPQNIVRDPTDDGAADDAGVDGQHGAMSTEDELAMAQAAINGPTDVSARRKTDQWEGPQDGVPSKRDQAILDRSPTDGMINSFVKRFPTWADQNNIAAGGEGIAGGDDDYALGADEKQDMYKGRKTRIDER